MLKNILLVFQSCLCTAGYAADLEPKMDSFQGTKATITLQQNVGIGELPFTTIEAVISGVCKIKSLIPKEEIKRFFEKDLHLSAHQGSGQSAKRFTTNFQDRHIVYMETSNSALVADKYVRFEFDPSAQDGALRGHLIPITCFDVEGNKITFRIKSESPVSPVSPPLTSLGNAIPEKKIEYASAPPPVPLHRSKTVVQEVGSTSPSTSPSSSRKRGGTWFDKFNIDKFNSGKKEKNQPSSPKESPKSGDSGESSPVTPKDVSSRSRSKTTFGGPPTVSDNVIEELSKRFKESSLEKKK